MAVVGVMGSGTAGWDGLAGPLGVWIAENGHDLLTGGGQGVMLSVARAFAGVPGRRGRSIGVLPTRPDPRLGFVPLEGYPNAFIDLPILTPLSRKTPDMAPEALSRNHVNIPTSDVVVILPGGHGTRDEAGLAVAYGKPAVAFGPAAEFHGLPEGLPVAAALTEVAGFIRAALGRV